MRKTYLLYLILFLVGSVAVHAQHKQLMYDFTEIPQSIMVNPGTETPYKWYAGIPVLSGFSISVGSSGISAGDVFLNDGIDITEKIRARVINGLKVRDELSITNQIELINVGFRGKNNSRNFYSFGVYNELDIIGYWPKDLAILGFEGNANQLGRRYDLKHIKTRGELLNVYHFGISKKVNHKLTVGVRAKIYASIIDVNSVQNKGYFVTNQGQNNLLENTLVADLEVRTSGVKGIEESLGDSIEGNTQSTLISRGLLGGNLGLGTDVGFTYHLNPQTVVTASVLDLGFIYHTKDIQNYTLKGNATVEGIDVILPDALLNPNENFWQNLVDEVEELIPFEENTKSYITFRPTKIYGSLRYNFEKRKPKDNGRDCYCSYKQPNKLRTFDEYLNGVGGQIYMINRPRGPQLSLTAFYQRKFGNFLTAKTTYTINKFSYTNVGLGISMKVGSFNMYMLADNLLAYQNYANSQYASFQFGLNILPWNINKNR